MGRGFLQQRHRSSLREMSGKCFAGESLASAIGPCTYAKKLPTSTAAQLGSRPCVTVAVDSRLAAAEDDDFVVFARLDLLLVLNF